MADLGIVPHIIEQILNHQSGHKAAPRASTIDRSYEREVRAALALWHDHVRTLVAGGERKVTSVHASDGLLRPSAAACYNDVTSWKPDLMSGDA